MRDKPCYHTYMLDSILHRWLRVPYTLHVRHLTQHANAKGTVLFIHGIGDTGDMWKQIISDVPKSFNIVAVDLLGFGDSPRPSWSVYDARAQARCLLATYLRLRMGGSVSIVGHSLGCLVAIDFARRYPLLIRRLVLCAPPIYRKHEAKKRPDDMLRELYTIASKNPSLLVRFFNLGQKLRLVHPSMSVTEDNIETFVRTLHASIINQRTIKDIAKVRVPITIINGIFDPFIVRGNLVELRNTHNNVHLVDIAAGHNISDHYKREILKALNE